MIEPNEIERLSRVALAAGVAEIELTDGADTLRLRLAIPMRQSQGEPRPTDVAPSPSEEPAGARSPGVGLFRHLHPVTGRPACEAGQQVFEGQVVGYVEAGSCLRPATALRSGVIGAPACDEGALVGYGTLLYPIH